MADIIEDKIKKLINYGKLQLSSKGVTSTATTLRDALDDIANISTSGTQATLNTPTISLSGSTLTLTNPTTNGNFATGFDLYNGSTKVATQLIDVTTLDLFTALTENGTYTITAKCYGANMTDSNASNSVSYTKSAAYNVVVSSDGSEIYVSGSINDVDELNSGVTNIRVTPNTTLTFTTKYSSDYFNSPTYSSGASLQTDYSHELSFLITGDTSISLSTYYHPCFVKGTLIVMVDGTFKKVEDIDYNDEVKGWNFDNGEQGRGKVFWIMQPQISNNYWNITLSNGKTIGLVGENGKSHRLFNATKGKFMYPQDFEKDDLTYDGINNEFVKVIKCENIHENVEYYNFMTSNILNNYANGILCGNRFSNIYPIEGMKFVKDNRQLVPREEYAEIPDYLYDGLRLAEQPIIDNDNCSVKYCNTMKEHIIKLYVNMDKRSNQ